MQSHRQIRRLPANLLLAFGLQLSSIVYGNYSLRDWHLFLCIFRKSPHTLAKSLLL